MTDSSFRRTQSQKTHRSVRRPAAGTPDEEFALKPERKNGAGNIYCSTSQGTLLDKWKEYTEGEDEDSIIKNIYTPQTSSGECTVIMGQKEELPSEEQKGKLRELRMKAASREQEEMGARGQFTSQQAVAQYDAKEASSPGGANFYAMPSQKPQKQSNAEDTSSDDEGSKRKDKWYKKAGKIFKHKH